MGLNSTSLDLMLNALGAVIGYVSLHTDAVGGGSGNEVSGGTPAYARKAITWNSSSGGDLDSSNQPQFDVPAGTIRRVGFFSAATAGTYYGDADITDETYGGQGTYTLTDVDITLT